MIPDYLTYLAGAFCPYVHKGRKYEDWRDFVIENVHNKKIKFYDPRKDSNQLCPATFTMDDAKKGVSHSNILLHYRTRGYEDEGAAWEHGIAFCVNLYNQELIETIKKICVELPELEKYVDDLKVFPDKLIVYVDDTRAIWPLNFSSANVNFSDLETAVSFLNRIKSSEKLDWIKIYMEIINRDRMTK